MRIAMAQINPTVADIDGNREKIISYAAWARDAGADCVVFPEMATIGYPPMDMLENRKLIDDNLASIEAIARVSDSIAIICGYVDRDRDNPPMLFNAAAVMWGGAVRASYNKSLLPTYDVFDELRYFSPGLRFNAVECGGRRIGITICEDIWNAPGMSGNEFIEHRRYDIDPVAELVANGADAIVNISASPFTMGKFRFKRMMLSDVARRHSVPVVYVNQVGGNDSLVFDGNSIAFDREGRVTACARSFEEDCVVVDIDRPAPGSEPLSDDDIEDVRRALVLGIRDYVRKCGFSDVVIGLSGGIDSALTAVLAVEALGAEHVTGVTMPSIYSSVGSVEDSRALARNLGIRFEVIPIVGLFNQYLKDLEPLFRGKPRDVTEENIQARIRGNILMAISNKERSLVLSTGNKSELAMGYCTLYGDMSGGLAVISDVPKTLVYKLAMHINRGGEVIPQACIDKPPSAELRENQKDQDTLPPYEVLDAILEMYIEDRKSAEEIVRAGFDPETVNRVLRTVNLNEYKRRQAAPGIKVTVKAFGVGRRYPVAQRFKP